MTATAILVGTVAGLILLQLACFALFLFFGSHWSRIPNVTFLRALGVTLAICVANVFSIILTNMLDRIPTSALWQAILIGVLDISITVGLMWWVIALLFKVSLWRAAWAWVPTLIPGVGFILLVLCVVRPYMFEAFKIPTNAMAPTIIGRHWEAPCPRCGSPAVATPEPEYVGSSGHPLLMMCTNERRACEVVDPPHAEKSGDRLCVNKMIRPQRWDVIVFRWPENPEINYCSRLVGLPGETVTIRDGAVWIDGEKQAPPDSCKGVEYLDRVKGWPGDLWGSEAKPARLGADEYFVLGDFSARSKDSRLWQLGATDHHPYAVPASHIVGVATHIYWPPSRCACLR